jgi:hypothetical protein
MFWYLLIFLHSFVLLIDNREDRAFGISKEALAMNPLVQKKRFFVCEGDLKTARLAKSLALDLKHLLLMVEGTDNRL